MYARHWCICGSNTTKADLFYWLVCCNRQVMPPNHTFIWCWLVGWLFWVKRPFETVFQSISGHLPERGRKRRERIEESKNVQTTPIRTYCKRNRPLPYYHPNCRTPRHWKFTQDHRTTRPPPSFGVHVCESKYSYMVYEFGPMGLVA